MNFYIIFLILENSLSNYFQCPCWLSWIASSNVELFFLYSFVFNWFLCHFMKIFHIHLEFIPKKWSWKQKRQNFHFMSLIFTEIKDTIRKIIFPVVFFLFFFHFYQSKLFLLYESVTVWMNGHWMQINQLLKNPAVWRNMNPIC